MKPQVFVIFLVHVFLSEGSQKKDASTATTEKDVLVIIESAHNLENVQQTATPNPQLQPMVEAEVEKSPVENISTDQHPLSSEATPKVARHLNSIPKMFRGEKIILSKVKRPFFSSKIPERHLKILKKMRDKQEMSEFLRYAPRSLDMGYGAGLANNFDLYGSQALIPSGTPNSLDHLYLPEFVAKDFIKPLDFNGLGNIPHGGGGHEIGNSIPYADSFGYQNSKPSNFRGNPIDVNFHSELGHGGFPIPHLGQNIGPRPTQEPYSGPPTTSGASGGGGAYPHNHNPPNHASADIRHQQHTHNPSRAPHQPQQAHDQSSKGSENPKQDSNPQDDGPSPTGSDEVQGDPGLWSILDLAHMLQGTNGLPEQLLNAAGPLQRVNSGLSDENYDRRHLDGPHHEGERDRDQNFNRNQGHQEVDGHGHQEHNNNRGHGFSNFGHGSYDEDSHHRGGNYESPDYDNNDPGKYKPFHASSPHGGAGGRIPAHPHYNSHSQSSRGKFGNKNHQSHSNGPPPPPRRPEITPDLGYLNDAHDHDHDGLNQEGEYPPGPEPGHNHNYDFEGPNNSEHGYDGPPSHQHQQNQHHPNRNSFGGNRNANQNQDRRNSPKNSRSKGHQRRPQPPNSSYETPNGFEDEGYYNNYNSHENFEAPERSYNKNNHHDQDSYGF